LNYNEQNCCEIYAGAYMSIKPLNEYTSYIRSLREYSGVNELIEAAKGEKEIIFYFKHRWAQTAQHYNSPFIMRLLIKQKELIQYQNAYRDNEYVYHSFYDDAELDGMIEIDNFMDDF
jgi:hypothetical protein